MALDTPTTALGVIVAIYTLWHGGASYAPSDVTRDVETFATVDDAVAEYERRRDGGDPYYPCVDESSEMWLYREDDPSDVRDPYPDAIVFTEVGGTTAVQPA